MRNLRVCIYGGTDIEGTPSKLISELSYQILASNKAIIVTGGFHHSNKAPTAKSTDVAALEGARRYAQENNIDINECFEAWVPEPELDDRNDVKGVIRMNENDGVMVKIIRGRTPLGRRLAMVAGVNLVITISGSKHTEVVIEQALELGIPVLPIPFAKGDSEELLDKYKSRIALAFKPGSLEACLKNLSTTFATDTQRAAASILELINTAKFGKCLILQPYDESNNDLYLDTIKPAVEKHMIPVRLNHLPGSKDIYTSFADELQTSTAVIADITDLNENVMYEVGYAHGMGLKPLLFRRIKNAISKLPVYLRNLNIRIAGKEKSLTEIIDEYLMSVKAKREL